MNIGGSRGGTHLLGGGVVGVTVVLTVVLTVGLSEVLTVGLAIVGAILLSVIYAQARITPVNDEVKSYIIRFIQ